MADPAPFKFRAFISYSHRDKAWGEWLHRALESYRIGKDLVGRATPVGPVPATLRPIFRDREDFSAGPSLAAATLAALEASQFLIVVCSPNAAKSEYVNQEIRRFKELGRSQFIIPVIVGGNPGEGDDQCFPPALRYKVGAGGTLTTEREEPIAADARDSGDGKPLATGKVIAGLLGIALDEIIRRAERQRRRRTRFWSALAGIFLGLAVVASGSAVYAWQQLRTNEEFLDATLDRFTSLVNRAVRASQSYSVPLRVTLGFLEEAEGILNVMARYGRPTPRLRQRQVEMLIAFGDSYRELGRTPEAERRIVEAERLLSELEREHAGDPTWRHEQARVHQRLGDLELAKGDPAAALRRFRAVREILEGLLKADPDNARFQRDLALALERIGMVQVEQGRFGEAYATAKAVLALRQRLLDALPLSLDRQQELAVANERLGDMHRAHGMLPEALASYRASLALVEGVAKAQPDNIARQRYLAIAHTHVGTILYAQGHYAEALKSYQIAFAIDERLVKSDPHNADWQRGLSVLHERIGDVLMAQKNPGEALPQFQASLAIRETIARGDPANVNWQGDLALAYERIGSVFAELKRSEEADAAYQRALEIYALLLERRPDNASLLLGSAMPLIRLGMLHDPNGVAYFEKALAILKQLDASGRLDPRRRSMIGVLENRIKALRAQTPR